MPLWTFVKRDWPPVNIQPDAHSDNFTRHQIQALSDIYKVFQSRLDSYRQSAAAIFIGVLAAVFTFDSAFLRFLIEPGSPNSNAAHNYDLLNTLVVSAAGALVIFSGAGAYIIWRFARYFAEMTSIVYKIDQANRVWEQGVWLSDDILFPNNFKSNRNVSVDRQKDPKLLGWRDLALDWFMRLTLAVVILQLILTIALFRHIPTSISAPTIKPNPAAGTTPHA
jgi:hypothetical protein